MTNTSIRYSRSVVADFHINPLGFRVELPNGSVAVVREVIGEGAERMCRVQGVTPYMRFCKLPKGVHHWYRPDELAILYFTASVRPEWRQS